MKEFLKKFIEKTFGTNTKKLTWYLSFLFGGSVVMHIIAMIQFGVDLVPLVIAVGTMYTIVLNAYFVKSFNENKEIYGGNKIDINELVEMITKTVKGE